MINTNPSKTIPNCSQPLVPRVCVCVCVRWVWNTTQEPWLNDEALPGIPQDGLLILLQVKPGGVELIASCFTKASRRWDVQYFSTHMTIWNHFWLVVSNTECCSRHVFCTTARFSCWSCLQYTVLLKHAEAMHVHRWRFTLLWIPMRREKSVDSPSTVILLKYPQVACP